MATGDRSDILARLKSKTLVPWFGTDSPYLDAVLTGIATPLSWGYDLVQFAKTQSRIATATGGWLDMAAWDYFGARFVRRSGELDDNWRARILPEILRERGTRKGVIQAVKDLTGRDPVMVEPTIALDCGAYGGPYLGYGWAGHYGTLAMPNQAFLIALRPSSSGISTVPGYGTGTVTVGAGALLAEDGSTITDEAGDVLLATSGGFASIADGFFVGGYGVSGKYGTLAEIQGPITDAMIYQTVADTQAAGVVIWTRIENDLPDPPATLGLDYSKKSNAAYIPGLSG